MAIGPEHNICKRIPVLPTSVHAAKAAGANPEDSAGGVSVQRYEVRDRHIEIELEMETDGFALLPFAYDSQLEITIDGEEAGRVVESAFGSICLAIKPGSHTIIIQPGLSSSSPRDDNPPFPTIKAVC